jgi:hypothetical protein
MLHSFYGPLTTAKMILVDVECSSILNFVALTDHSITKANRAFILKLKAWKKTGKLIGQNL